MQMLFTMILLFVLLVICLNDMILMIAKKLNRKISSYMTFGATVVLCGLIVISIALYDILTPGGDLNGMFGQILLMVYIPTVVVMITGDVIVWHIKKKNNGKDADKE
ncbi:MAG: hypothetical protein IJL67_10135 [Oscillospiraceae bacterium]|nr:hypothetical protein [Oscillospiraceae bacterium]